MTAIGVFEFSAKLWLHSGGSWHFVTVPVEVSDDIRDLTDGIRHGFGSVRVAARIGRTSWRTSVFPVSSDGTYVLPVKKAVRAAENLAPGDAAVIRLELVDL